MTDERRGQKDYTKVWIAERKSMDESGGRSPVSFIEKSIKRTVKHTQQTRELLQLQRYHWTEGKEYDCKVDTK